MRQTIEVADGPELEQVRQWIEINREAIIAYWYGDLLADKAIARLKPVPP